MITYLIAISCVLGLVVGQVLFKTSATMMVEAGSFFSIKPMLILIIAMCLYGVTSAAWVWVLKHAELGRVYPLMAFAFILVPLGSYLFFGEKFSSQYFIGIFLISMGIIVSMRS